MEELIAKLDAEIAALQAEVGAVEVSIADKRTKLHRLRQAKASLTSTSNPKPSSCVAKRTYVPLSTTREMIAQLMEVRGAMRTGEIANEIGVALTTPYQAMRGHPWFVMDGAPRDKSTTWSLTEAGRNRYKTLTAV